MALIVYLLAAYQKFIFRLGISVQQMHQLIQVNLLRKLSLKQLFNPRGVYKKFKELGLLKLEA